MKVANQLVVFRSEAQWALNHQIYHNHNPLELSKSWHRPYSSISKENIKEVFPGHDMPTGNIAE